MENSRGTTAARAGLTDAEIEELPAVLLIEEAGAILRLSPNAARRMVREGRFPVQTIPVGDRQRICKHTLLTHLGIVAA